MLSTHWRHVTDLGKGVRFLSRGKLCGGIKPPWGVGSVRRNKEVPRERNDDEIIKAMCPLLFIQHSKLPD